MSRQRRARSARLHGLSRRRLRRRSTPLLLAVAAAVTIGTAFTASITGLPSVSAGATSTPWPTFTLTAGPTYDSIETPTTVTFTITPAAGQARARTSASGWHECTTANGGTTWTCPATGADGSFAWLATP